MKLDHVQVAIPLGSEEEGRWFYGGVLGFPELPKPAAMAVRGGLWFRVGGCQLHLGAETEFRPAKKAHPAFRLPDVVALEALANRLEGEGRPIRWAEDLPGQVRFFSEDPFGNRLEFMADEGVMNPA